ncbi:hypothetical protein BDW71DRAFT_191104 [Aspergillus fruticulosus]
MLQRVVHPTALVLILRTGDLWIALCNPWQSNVIANYSTVDLFYGFHNFYVFYKWSDIHVYPADPLSEIFPLHST